MVEYDESVVGVEHELGSFTVTDDAIASYCEALGETNPLYLDEEFARGTSYGGRIAPPLIFTTVNFRGTGPDPKVEFGNARFLGGERVEVLEPMRPGDTITAYGQVTEVYEKTGRSGKMVFVVRRTRYENQRGRDVALVDSSMVHREIEA